MNKHLRGKYREGGLAIPHRQLVMNHFVYCDGVQCGALRADTQVQHLRPPRDFSLGGKKGKGTTVERYRYVSALEQFLVSEKYCIVRSFLYSNLNSYLFSLCEKQNEEFKSKFAKHTIEEYSKAWIQAIGQVAVEEGTDLKKSVSHLVKFKSSQNGKIYPAVIHLQLHNLYCILKRFTLAA